MAAVAHNPAFAKKVGIPVSVGKDFTAADKGKKFGLGGRVDLQKINQPKTKHGQEAILSKGENIMAKKMCGGGKAKKMASGGIAASGMGKVTAGGKRPHGEHTVQEKGHTKGKNLGDTGKVLGLQGGAKSGKGVYGAAPIKMAKGGSASSRADGIASKGKTKGKWC